MEAGERAGLRTTLVNQPNTDRRDAMKGGASARVWTLRSDNFAG
jgi:hypothetical protein